MDNAGGLEPHPILDVLSEAELGTLPEELRKQYVETRRLRLQLALSDPHRYGWELAVWAAADMERAELRQLNPKGVIYEINLGGHRSGKSERAAKRVVQAMVKKPGSRWWCAEATEKASRGNQQRLIEKYLPAEWKPGKSGQLRKSRDRVVRVNYTVAGGFSENILVLPNGSECEFKFYEQKIGTLQAVELDGFWGDELLPFDWIKEIEYRLINRDGVFHLTFTPVEGYTHTVGHFLEGGKIVEERDAKLLPIFDDEGKQVGNEKVPRIVHSADKRARVIFFRTSDNPLGNYEGRKEQVRDKSREEIRMRVYGVTTKTAHVQFPKFSDPVHVISLNKFRELERQFPRAERYHLVDPCSGRNWFMIWVFCHAPDKWIVYREWPTTGHSGAYSEGVGDPGPWTVFGPQADGARGPAQNSFGFGLARYVEEINRAENGEEILERWIDSRYAHAATLEREGATTLIEQLSELGMDFRASVSERNILTAQDGSIDMINSALYYDEKCKLGEFSKELARVNVPQLQVVETCPNTIYALKNWTGKDGVHGACKDPIDGLRMLFLSRIGYAGEEMYRWVRY